MKCCDRRLALRISRYARASASSPRWDSGARSSKPASGHARERRVADAVIGRGRRLMRREQCRHADLPRQCAFSTRGRSTLSRAGRALPGIARTAIRRRRRRWSSRAAQRRLRQESSAPSRRLVAAPATDWRRRARRVSRGPKTPGANGFTRSGDAPAAERPFVPFETSFLKPGPRPRRAGSALLRSDGTCFASVSPISAGERRDGDARGLERRDLVARASLAARDDRARVAHALARRRVAARR